MLLLRVCIERFLVRLAENPKEISRASCDSIICNFDSSEAAFSSSTV